MGSKGRALVRALGCEGAGEAVSTTAVVEDPARDALLLAAASPASFAHITSQGSWVPYEHLILLNDYLLRLDAGEVERLIVTMPPGYGKSELISRWLPAWYLGRHPERNVMLTSYDKTLVEDHGGAAREMLTEWGPSVFGVQVTDTASQRWHVAKHGGMMLARPLAGAIPGRRAHLIIVDDPIKGALEAQSERYRERVWQLWLSNVSTRFQVLGAEKAPTAVIVVMTRWHQDDLVGRLQATGKWTTLSLPAIAVAPKELEGKDRAGWRDELGRKEGEALCPELVSAEELGGAAGRKRRVLVQCSLPAVAYRGGGHHV